VAEPRIVPAHILPHGSPSRLLTEVVTATSDRLVARARVPVANAFVREGRVPALVTIEMAAQAAALSEALRLPGGVPPRVRGFLVGAKETELLADDFAADAGVEIEVTPAPSAPPLLFFRFEAREAGRALARGSVSIYVTADEA
jgi:predicted hotdog family 3-hydroxylacyl-ACP dehydratase